MSKVPPSRVSARRQQGVSLLVVLILLLVMSLLGIAVLRSSALQERMRANMVDRNEAVQAAETGLLVAQQSVIRGTFNPMWNGSQTFTALRTGAGKTCAGHGYCDRSDPNGDPSTPSATWETAIPPATAAYTVMANGARYAFTVEYLGLAKGESNEVISCDNTASVVSVCKRPMFRVTSYGRGRGMAQAVLQSNILSQSQ